jgi:phosphoenolpyruvate carboxylase
MFNYLLKKTNDMDKKVIKLNESELNQLIEECIQDILNEGFFDKMNAAWKGAKQGYNGQKMLDRGTDNFKQNLDREDMLNMANPMASRPENTASEQAREAYKQYNFYQQKANEMLNLYNKLRKQYDLDKTGVGQVQSKEKPNTGFAGQYKMGQKPSTITNNFRNKHRSMTNMPTMGLRGRR